ncbi:MAG TPA: cytochrome c [Rudaea sp.]|nr:cytochrome c [Rudaea sp.]
MKSVRIVIAVLAASVATAAIAEHKPESVIHYRQSVMTVMGWNLSAMAQMVKGDTPWDTQQFTERAEHLESLAPQIAEGFTKGSDKGAKTDAKADIWANPDDFHAKDHDLVTETKTLAAVARSGDADKMKQQFKQTAHACKACHEKFKAD